MNVNLRNTWFDSGLQFKKDGKGYDFIYAWYSYYSRKGNQTEHHILPELLALSTIFKRFGTLEAFASKIPFVSTNAQAFFRLADKTIREIITSNYDKICALIPRETKLANKYQELEVASKGYTPKRIQVCCSNTQVLFWHKAWRTRKYLTYLAKADIYHNFSLYCPHEFIHVSFKYSN